MSTLGDRKRVEIPGDLYRELERDASTLRVSTASLATMLLSTALKQARELSQSPFRGTGPAEPTSLIAPSMKGV